MRHDSVAEWKLTSLMKIEAVLRRGRLAVLPNTHTRPSVVFVSHGTLRRAHTPGGPPSLFSP